MYALIKKTDNTIQQRFYSIPKRLDLDSKTKVFGANANWQNDDYKILEVTMFTPESGYMLQANTITYTYNSSNNTVTQGGTSIEIPPKKYTVSKRTIIKRLNQAELLGAARSALDQADLYTREKWNTVAAVNYDDPTSIAFLTAIGANSQIILAREDD